MNDYEEGRKRGRSLLVVEGEHEKDRLFWLILRCFPEIEIDEGNIWVYHTNIYNQLIDWIHKQHYAEHGLTYWQYMRNVLRKIAIYNILKADYIQHETQNTDEDDNSYRRHYENIDFLNILNIQNELSRDRQNGYIWVLNTCIMYIAEYNFRLIEQEKGDNQ